MAVSADDPDGTVKAINAALNDKAYETMVAATESCRARYHWSNMEPRLVGIYQDLGVPVTPGGVGLG